MELYCSSCARVILMPVFFCLRCESIPFISIFARAYKLMPTNENRWCCTKMMVCDEQQCQSGSSHSVRSTRDATKISILHKCNKKNTQALWKKPCLFSRFVITCSSVSLLAGILNASISFFRLFSVSFFLSAWGNLWSFTRTFITIVNCLAFFFAAFYIIFTWFLCTLRAHTHSSLVQCDEQSHLCFGSQNTDLKRKKLSFGRNSQGDFYAFILQEKMYGIIWIRFCMGTAQSNKYILVTNWENLVIEDLWEIHFLFGERNFEFQGKKSIKCRCIPNSTQALQLER